MDLKKEAFLKAYEKSFGNITQSCAAVPICRKTYYDWMKADEEFKAKVEAVEPAEVFLDFAENALTQRIQDKDTTAIIFALKTKGKKRGYIERTEIAAQVDTSKKPSWFDELDEKTTSSVL